MPTQKIADFPLFAGKLKVTNLGNWTTGFNSNPGTGSPASNPATMTLDNGSWLYDSLLLVLEGDVVNSTTTGVTLNDKREIYDILRTISNVKGGDQNRYNTSGMMLYALEQLFGGGIGTNVMSNDILPQAPSTTAGKFRLTWKVPFRNPALKPDFLNLLNAYKGAGVESFYIQAVFGSAPVNFYTGDAGASLSNLILRVSAFQYDYDNMAPIYTKSFAEKAVLPEFQPIELGVNALQAAPGVYQNVQLNRLRLVSGLLIAATTGANVGTPVEGAIQQVQTQINQQEIQFKNMDVNDIAADNAAKLKTSLFLTGNDLDNFIYLNFCRDNELTQMINAVTYPNSAGVDVTQFLLMVQAQTACNLRILQLQEYVPNLSLIPIQQKNPYMQMLTLVA